MISIRLTRLDHKDLTIKPVIVKEIEMVPPPGPAAENEKKGAGQETGSGESRAPE